MLRPRVRPASAALLVTATVALGASCSFPVIIFQEGSSGGGGSTSASTSTSSTMAITTSSAGGAGGAGGSTTSESASTSESTSSGTGGSLPCITPCDCDGDGVKAVLDSCGGKDCADYDERAHPGAGFVYDTEKIRGPKSAKTTDFDFNCNGLTEPEYGLSDCKSLTSCDNGSGFTQATACGIEGVFVPCTGSLNLCSKQTEVMKKQGCR